MRAHQLLAMLATLRSVFEDHPDGMRLDAEMTGALAAGLRDMECAAAALEQRSVELDELRLECGISARLCQAEDGPDNVIPFPIVARPIPVAIQDGGAA